MKQKEYIVFSGMIFGAIAILHLLRFVYAMPVTVGEWGIPVWASAVGVIVAGFLAWKAKGLSR